jgi:P27 family predicted phage terminase small subunit
MSTKQHPPAAADRPSIADHLALTAGSGPSKPPAPPRHLPPHERDLWKRIVSAFAFSDPASCALLAVALEAHVRCRTAREAIDADGASVRDRFGQLRAHPLTNVERDARTAFLQAMRSLNLDLGATNQ